MDYINHNTTLRINVN